MTKPGSKQEGGRKEEGRIENNLKIIA